MSKARSTLYPNGIVNADPNTFAAITNLRMDDPTKFVYYFEDFAERFNPSQVLATGQDWTITEVGTPTEALTDVVGGALLLTNSGADNDSVFLNLLVEPFQWASDKEMWFAARFKMDDVTQSDFVMGLQISDTTPLDVPDGIFFLGIDEQATIDFLIEKDNTATTLADVVTLVDDTEVELAFHYDGLGTFNVYADDALIGSTTVLTNAPDDELLTISFGIQNGEAAINAMEIDYILAVVER